MNASFGATPVAKPADPASMSDDYQDVRVVADDGDAYTLEIVYYPLNDNARAIGADPAWRADDATMTAYIAPSATVNWDAAMQGGLRDALALDGIRTEPMTDRDLVRLVSTWALGRADTTSTFSLWYVDLSTGSPTVIPELRPAFENEKRKANAASDSDMFGSELLGREMFSRRTHGSCSSSATYLATVLRALGVPTRIVVMVPPADPKDPAQGAAFVDSIRLDPNVRTTIEAGLDRLSGSFANHIFNEVFVGGRWTRLNFSTLGQNILDARYLVHRRRDALQHSAV
jgi:hypothetical protein